MTQLIARTMRAAHDAAAAIVCRPRKDARQAQPGQATFGEVGGQLGGIEVEPPLSRTARAPY
ncbi:hypothetical protein [Frankia sp. EAN1pec]|uniref:hypothetical protein n=1 Tax=Parafrankia sp. (strain EAN1pec) TaxID=298653 RepID=UPI0012FBD968